MDANDLRALFTVIMCLLFVGIVIWAYSSRNRERFAAAARLPLEEDQPDPQTAGYEGTRK
jgi:cytochrome c oxidase cbb3-type subunit 4